MNEKCLTVADETKATVKKLDKMLEEEQFY